jgi:hypothetical protein
MVPAPGKVAVALALKMFPLLQAWTLLGPKLLTSPDDP